MATRITAAARFVPLALLLALPACAAHEGESTASGSSPAAASDAGNVQAPATDAAASGGDLVPPPPADAAPLEPLADASAPRPEPDDAGAGADATADSAAPAPDAAAEPGLGFDPPPGTFDAPFQLALSAVPDSAEIYYTLDGSYPTSAAQRYTAPLAIDATTLVRVAVYDGGAPIVVESASYVQVAPALADFSSNLPIAVLHTLAGPAPLIFSDARVPAVAQMHDREADGRARLLGAAALDARTGLKVRGRSTRLQGKPSYSLEIRDQNEEDDEDAVVLDFPPQSDWALYAPYYWDRALIRNAVWYTLSNAIGRYAPRTRFVEVFAAQYGRPLDTSAYRGVYVWTETIKRDHQRVDVAKLAADDSVEPAVTGGYLVRVDDPDPGEMAFPITGIPQELVIRYPKADTITTEQQHYILDYLDATGRAFHALGQRDPVSGRALRDLIDVDAFIDHHILNTLAKNPDAFRLSAYMYKDRGGKLVAGPIWDCDRCMGSYDGRDADPAGWSATFDGTDLFGYGWWADLFADPEIEARYWARFAELLDGPFADARMNAIIDPMAAELDEAAERNFARFPAAAPLTGAYRDEIDHLKQWLAARVRWIRNNLARR